MVDQHGSRLQQGGSQDEQLLGRLPARAEDVRAGQDCRDKHCELSSSELASYRSMPETEAGMKASHAA